MSGPKQDRPPRKGPLGLFERLYGAGPLHLIGHLVVIGITAYVLSIIFQHRFAPRPWNLALWLLGGAVFHDAVFLPVYSVINILIAKTLRGGNDDTLFDGAFGPPPRGWDIVPPQPTADMLRRVPILNHIRTPIVICAVLLLLFWPRISVRQPQNFENALGHAPPDYFGRWLFCVGVIFAASALLYAVRWVRAGRAHAAPAAPQS